MDVVALGELLIDFSTISVMNNGYPVMQANPGGAPANYLAALSKYGFETSFIGKIGQDAFGFLLEETLREKGINTDRLVKSGEFFTTLAFVTFDKDGDRSFSFARKPGADAALREDEIDFELIDSAQVFHFGTVSMTEEPALSATKKAVEWAKSHDKMISFDPNYRAPLWEDTQKAREAILWGLKMADVVKISDDEVSFLWKDDYRKGAERIINECDVKLVFVTRGPEGCYFQTKNSGGLADAPKVKTRDTTGAGDIFGGSAMSRILKTGKTPEELNQDELNEIVRFALTAASLSTEKSGGIESIPDESDVIEAVKRFYNNV